MKKKRKIQPKGGELHYVGDDGKPHDAMWLHEETPGDDDEGTFDLDIIADMTNDEVDAFLRDR